MEFSAINSHTRMLRNYWPKSIFYKSYNLENKKLTIWSVLHAGCLIPIKLEAPEIKDICFYWQIMPVFSSKPKTVCREKCFSTPMLRVSIFLVTNRCKSWLICRLFNHLARRVACDKLSFFGRVFPPAPWVDLPGVHFITTIIRERSLVAAAAAWFLALARSRRK